MINLLDLFVKSTIDISTAISILDKNVIKILLVIDDNNKLLGVVTDGDIRRGLLRHISFDNNISKIMCANPIVSLSGKSRIFYLDEMRSHQIFFLPIVNKAGEIQNVEFFHDLIAVKKRENPVVLMAGGFGKRLRPLTYDTPKPMLKVGDKPIIESILERFIRHGFNKFYISVFYKSEVLQDHFGDGSKWNVSIKYIKESSPLGTAGSLSLLPNLNEELSMIVMNGDILSDINFENLLDFHEERGGVATICAREYDFKIPYGVLEFEDCLVTKINEKPVQRFFVNAGVYVVEQKFINSIQKNTYSDMPHHLQSFIDKGENVNIFPLHESWLDIGRIEEYNLANESK